MQDRIVIIGTGLTGMVQAMDLLHRGFDVTLIGPLPDFKADKRSTAILLPGIVFFKALGFWQKMSSFCTPLATMELVDGQKHTLFDAHEIGEVNFGYNIPNAVLKKSLYEALTKSSALKWHKQNVTSFQKTAAGWQLSLQDNTSVTATLLIGADGRNSPVRHAANIAIETKQIDQTAMVGTVKTEKSHFNTTVEWYRKGGPMTLVPAGKNEFAFVWCDQADSHKKRQQHDPIDIANEFSELTAYRFGKLNIQGNLQLWPIQPFLARNLIGDHCALIGEAAHALPPIGAQGFNASLQDIIALTATLEQGRRIGYRLNDPVLLSGYEKARHSEINLRAKAINTLNATLLSDSFLPHRLRRFSLSGLQHFSVLKKQIMQIGLSPIRINS